MRLDLVNFSGFAQVLQSQMPAGQTYPLSVRTTVIVQLVMLLPASATNAMFTVGEEIGWRGFLMSSLRPLGTWPALVISGAMWGLWHAPLILLGYDFGRRDALGVLLMIVSCVILGTLFGWLRIRSGNIWPSVFGHAALNGTAGFLGLVVAAGESPSVLATSPWAGSGGRSWRWSWWCWRSPASSAARTSGPSTWRRLRRWVRVRSSPELCGDWPLSDRSVTE